VLQYRDQRHDVIAANIANANTPGYRAFDLVLSDALGGGAPLALTRTDPRHIAPEGRSTSFGGQTVASNAPPRLDGNNVSLDSEFIKLTENRIMYQTAFELHDKLKSLSRAARELR
jgi:flagellar basal-body rod protein FlgB